MTEVVLVRRVVKVFGAIPTLATSRGEPEGSSWTKCWKISWLCTAQRFLLPVWDRFSAFGGIFIGCDILKKSSQTYFCLNSLSLSYNKEQWWAKCTSLTRTQNISTFIERWSHCSRLSKHFLLAWCLYKTVFEKILLRKNGRVVVLDLSLETKVKKEDFFLMSFFLSTACRLWIFLPISALKVI